MALARVGARPNTSRVLFLFADGGALHDLTERMRAEEGAASESRRIDFTQIPSQAMEVLARDPKVASLDCPTDARVFFAVGAASGKVFRETMSNEWTVETLPLGLCKYERAPTPDATSKTPYRVRFHAQIGYHLGFLAGSLSSASRDFLVGIVSDDPQLIPVVADARRRGVDARLVWFAAALPQEVGYFAARNEVPVVSIESSRSERSAASRLDQLTALIR